MCTHQKGWSWPQAISEEMVETGDKKWSVTSTMHVLWRRLRKDQWERCQAFLEWVCPWILWLESVDYLGTSKHFSGQGKKNHNQQWLKWSGVVNFNCMQMSLMKSMQFILGNDWSDAPCSSRFALWQCNFSVSRPLIFVQLYTYTRSIQKQLIKYDTLYYYMRNFCNLIGLEPWYFSLIWNTYMWKLPPFAGSSINR